MDINKKGLPFILLVSIVAVVVFLVLTNAILISGVDANVMVASASIFLAVITFFMLLLHVHY